MGNVSIEQVKELRSRTGVSVMQCKKALEEAGGDPEKAIEFLKQAGSAVAAKKADRDLGAGVVSAYIHAGSIGAMCELLCETDFVAKNDEFKVLAYDIAMQIAATDDDIIEKGAEELMKQPFIKDPSQTIGDLVEGAIQKFGERIELGRIVKFSI